MTAAIEWRIPPSVLRHLDEVPTDVPVAMLIRHSVRDELPPGEAGYVLPITEVGATLARELGSRLGSRLRSLRSSPLVRTMQTARELARGAGRDLEVCEDRLLGDPGAFVLDGRAAGEAWRELGHEAVMDHLVRGAALPGLADAEVAARFLVRSMLSATRGEAGLHAFVTHDSLVTAAAAQMLGVRITPVDWPWYLEAAFFWETDGGVEVRYRDWRRTMRGPLCSLGDQEIVDFAKREIAATVGPDFEGRFFLSGGAFKSLLTGRAPHDLDFWAPTERDRAMLVARLQERGATPLDARPYSEGWRLRGRVVDVPHKAEPDTLEARHARFDLALAAVGVEHLNGREWRAVVHPRARESVERRQVLLLTPIANPRYALATLERGRRYAEELGFEWSKDAEATLWEVFDAAPKDERQRMLNRFAKTARGGLGVAEEAARRVDGAAST